MKRHAPPGLPCGCPYPAVGMQRALDSAIGLPSRSTSASWMLVFLIPADVRRNLMLPLGATVSERCYSEDSANAQESSSAARTATRTNFIGIVLARARFSEGIPLLPRSRRRTPMGPRRRDG